MPGISLTTSLQFDLGTQACEHPEGLGNHALNFTARLRTDLSLLAVPDSLDFTGSRLRACRVRPRAMSEC